MFDEYVIFSWTFDLETETSSFMFVQQISPHARLPLEAHRVTTWRKRMHMCCGVLMFEYVQPVFFLKEGLGKVNSHKYFVMSSDTESEPDAVAGSDSHVPFVNAFKQAKGLKDVTWPMFGFRVFAYPIYGYGRTSCLMAI